VRCVGREGFVLKRPSIRELEQNMHITNTSIDIVHNQDMLSQILLEMCRALGVDIDWKGPEDKED